MIARRMILTALALLATLAGHAVAQSPYPAGPPSPVPGLPDSARLTQYSITSSICGSGCPVNFQLYGTNTDYQSWVEVFLNGVQVAYNDPVYGWTITSPTGSLSIIPRPITDAVLTFNNAQTGTVVIVGAERPRRTATFNENAGVPARAFNQALNDLYAIDRETWDKINDVTGRGLFFAPGNTTGPMPTAAQCANAILGFDGTGLNPLCEQLVSSGSLSTPATTINGDLATFNSTNGKSLGDSGIAAANVDTLSGSQTITGNKTFSGSSSFSGRATFGSGRPWIDVTSGANGCAAAVGNGTNDDTTAIQCQANYIHNQLGAGVLYFPLTGNNFHTTGTVDIYPGTRVICVDPVGVTIGNASSDFTVLDFQGSGSGGEWEGLENCTIQGSTSVSSVNPAVKVEPNTVVNMHDCRVFGGEAALQTSGSDGYVENCYFSGMTYGATSNGNNWYVRDKFDGPFLPGVATTYAFLQGVWYSGGSGVLENHFTDCDFSGSGGNVWSYSFFINASAGTSPVTSIVDGVFAAPISLTGATVTMISNAEFGNASFSASGQVNITGSAGIGVSVTVSGGTRSCAGNSSITC